MADVPVPDTEAVKPLLVAPDDSGGAEDAVIVANVVGLSASVVEENVGVASVGGGVGVIMINDVERIVRAGSLAIAFPSGSTKVMAASVRVNITV
jgi:hypothetical protein